MSGCEVEGESPKQRVLDPDGKVVERLWGPFEPCGRGPSFVVHAFVERASVQITQLRVARDCSQAR
jgi:hypothetical protein